MDLIERLVTVWKTPGSEGDLSAVLSALFADPEFTAGVHFGTKAKRPLTFMASLWRALGPGAEGTSNLVGQRNSEGSQNVSFRGFYPYITRMGEDLFLVGPPTGLSEESAFWASASGAVARWDWADRVVDLALTGSEIDPLQRFGLSQGAPTAEIVASLEEELLPASITPTTEAQLTAYLDAAIASDPQIATSELVRRGASLLLSSPEFARH